jgi:hypothetical protein
MGEKPLGLNWKIFPVPLTFTVTTPVSAFTARTAQHGDDGRAPSTGEKRAPSIGEKFAASGSWFG